MLKSNKIIIGLFCLGTNNILKIDKVTINIDTLLVTCKMTKDTERTLIIIKPHAVKRGLVGKILTKFENRGLKILKLCMQYGDTDVLNQHYDNLRESKYFPLIIKGMQDGPLVAAVLEGKSAVSLVRKTLGCTNPADADPSSIRGMYATDIGKNICHASDSVETANKEISLWFPGDVTTWVSETDTLTMRLDE